MESGRRRRSRAQSYEERIAREAIDIAALSLNVTIQDLRAASREPRSAFARQLAMYLAHVVGQLPMTTLAACFDRDRTTIGHACAMIEDRRDDPLFDRQIQALEREMRSRLRRIGADMRREIDLLERARRARMRTR